MKKMEGGNSMPQDNSNAARAKRKAAREAAACAARRAALETDKAARRAAREAAREAAARRAARERAFEMGQHVVRDAIAKANLFLDEEVEKVDLLTGKSGEKSAWFNHVTDAEIIERFLHRYPQFKDSFPQLTRRGSSGLTALKRMLLEVAKQKLGCRHQIHPPRRRQINPPTASGARSTRGFVGWRWRFEKEASS